MSAIETLDAREEYRELVEQEQVIYGLAGPNAEDAAYHDDLYRVAAAREKVGARLQKELGLRPAMYVVREIAADVYDAVGMPETAALYREGVPVEEAKATYPIRVFGPNLRDQSKGEFHAHLDGCADCAKYDEEGWLLDVETIEDLAREIYPPEEFGYDGETEVESYASTIWVAPCVAKYGRVYSREAF